MQKINRYRQLLFIMLLGYLSMAQDRPPVKPNLTVSSIMRDPKWIGNQPGDPYWSEDGKTVYFMWNPTNADADSLYQVSSRGGQTVKVPRTVRQQLPNRFGQYTRD